MLNSNITPIPQNFFTQFFRLWSIKTNPPSNYCIIIFRHDDEKYSLDVINKASYYNRTKRRMISLKICFVGWMFETLHIVFAIMAPQLYELGMPGTQYLKVLIMFLAIPLLHLMNDDDIKSAIAENGWNHGIKHILTF